MSHFPLVRYLLTPVFSLFTFHFSLFTQSLPAALNEISGLVRTPSGDYWALADSGNEPELYRVDPDKQKILETRRLPVPNRDWEELTTDKIGRLYIGDFGNNANRRRDLCIYRYDPVSRSLDSILFAYPDQLEFPPTGDTSRRFDCEAMVWFADSLHLFTKSRFKGDKKTHHYVLPAVPGVQTAQHRDSLRLSRVLTGAALSPDGSTLAFCGYIVGFHLGFIPFSRASVFFIRNFSGGYFLKGDFRKRRLPKCIMARQYESIAWLSDSRWLVANEKRGAAKPRIRKIKQR